VDVNTNARKNNDASRQILHGLTGSHAEFTVQGTDVLAYYWGSR
jgi:hypothetical protein